MQSKKDRIANEAAHQKIIRVPETEMMHSAMTDQQSTLVTEQQMEFLSQQRQQHDIMKQNSDPLIMTEAQKGKRMEHV